MAAILVMRFQRRCLNIMVINMYIGQGQTPGGGGGGTLKFSIYIGEADFIWVKILNFHILGGFQKKTSYFFRVVSFLWIFCWGHAFSELFFWGHL